MENLPIVSKEKILLLVCQHYKISPLSVRNQDRKKEIRFPRQVIAYLCCKYSGLTLYKIGDYLERNHATILHSRNTIQNEIDTNVKIRMEIEEIKSKLFEFTSDENLVVPRTIDLLKMSQNYTQSLISNFG